MKVLLFANTDWYLYNFRLPLAFALRASGHEVVLVSPPGAYCEKLIAAGFRWLPFSFERNGVNPIVELITLGRLIYLYRRERPDVAHHFTIKCTLYGGIAAWLSATRGCVAAVTGMGHIFITDSATTRLLRPVVSLLYRLVLRPAQVVFQNPDDRDAFFARGLAGARNSHLIRGSGVNTSRFTPPDTQSADEPIVIMVARLLREKGIAEFVWAASLVREKHPRARFLVAGGPDPGNPSSVSEGELAAWRSDSPVEFLGHVEDVLPLLHRASMCVLPSYREGTPRSLVEAAACGLPLVATDVPGCREIVRQDENGILVPPKDAISLADAITYMLDHRDDMRRMGSRGRQIAVEEFSEQKVISETLEVYAKALKR